MNKPIAVLAAVLVVYSAGVSAQAHTATGTMHPATGAQPDNSKSNKLDESNKETTAEDQSNSAGDIDVTKRIRRSLTSDKSLSTYAHNVKIVTVNGKVTLNGVVRSDEEKSAVEMKAAEVAGKGKVTNELKVAPKS